jgi:ABC-2 type transport system permease protein
VIAGMFAQNMIGPLMGIAVGTAEDVHGFTALFPLMFLSGIFVPLQGLPTPLRQIAEWNPPSAVATAVRELFHNPAPHAAHAWPLVHPVAATILYSLAIIAVFAPLAVRRYRRL